ncbi:MAG: hypothetical protein SBU_000418 [Candidatus Syntrophoarchaeum butanivorans]|uniref:Uncharacterized protein n=1 Tax=Candidatus Syntropharchaeum butanivorans TaxID=1839936 RepID=A0A1F2P6Z0_9EURY|nr:MAG: hypothetical protein SBU_000418 [Candidatus Syntrophoarchaeum butanivorans]
MRVVIQKHKYSNVKGNYGGDSIAGICPRCGEEKGAEIGEIELPIGKTRRQPVSIKLCGGCGLVFYEKIEKVKEFA